MPKASNLALPETLEAFMQSIKDIPFFQINPAFDLSGCKVFETKKGAVIAAYYASCKVAEAAPINSALRAATNAINDVANESASCAGIPADLAFVQSRLIAFLRRAASSGQLKAGNPPIRILKDAIADLSLYAILHYACADLCILPKQRNYIERRYAIWLNGYGVLCDINGTFYIYRRP